MADTAARMLELLALLQLPRDWPGSELARRLEVSGRTLRRDIDRLRDLGYPIEATMGAVGGYRLVGGAAMPPLLLDDQEAVAIAVGLRTVVGHAVEGMEDASVRALAKLQQVLPPRLRSRVGVLSAATVPLAWPVPRVDPGHLTVLAAAATNHERVRFDYTGAVGAESLRLVEPNGLVAAGRRWYLVAWDVDRGGWRTFRVDRLRDPRPLPGRVAPRELPADDAAAYVRARLESAAPTSEAVAVVHAPADEVRPKLPDGYGDVESIDDGRCRLRLQADTIDWLAFRLVLLGYDFEVEEPAELVDYVAAVGERLTRATQREGVRRVKPTPGSWPAPPGRKAR